MERSLNEAAEGVWNVTLIRNRWTESEDNVVQTSLAAKISPQNIADFLGRDVNEVIERINYLTKPAEATATETVRVQKNENAP